MSKTKPATVLVTDAERGSSLSIIRSLGQQQLRVIASDAKSSSLGFKSRYVYDTLVYPNPETSPEAFAKTMLSAAQSIPLDLIIPVTDAAILPLSQIRDQFDGVCQIAMPDPVGLDIVTDKLKTIELARKLNVPTPVTHLVHTVDEAVRVAPEFTYPIVLKPQRSRQIDAEKQIQSFSVTYAHHPTDLIERMKEFENRCAVLLQEYHQGEGHGVELLTAKGQPLTAFQHKRLREVPLTGGVSSFRESVPLDPTLYEYSVRLLKALNWTGLAMVEFKVGHHGARLMEINGRVWGSLPLATHSGMDFPAYLADLYLNPSTPLPSKPNVTYKIGVRSRYVERDLVWIISVLIGRQRSSSMHTPSRLEAIRAALGWLNPTYKSDIMSLHDPMPGIALIPAILRKFLRKMRS
jgi:predicted ATP-grasp superfamily ATP-dependent carboligase